jgi:hypothetical protein
MSLSKVCPHCHQPFELKRKDQRYCSHNCRSQASAKRTQLNGNESPTQMKSDLTSYLMKEVDFWKSENSKNQALVEQLKEEKLNGPGGLAGIADLLQGPLGEALAPVISKFLSGGSHLTGSQNGDERIQKIVGFWASNSPELQNALFEFLDVLAGRSPEENLKLLNYLNGAAKGAAIKYEQ